MKVARPNYLFRCAVVSGLAMLASAGCGQANQTGGEPTAASLDPLVLPSGDAGLPDSGIFACPSCIQSSCGSSLTALETELTSLRSEARSAFACVMSSHCFAMFSIARDAG